MRDHYFWRHVHISGGICFFCLNESCRQSEFSNEHIRICLRGICPLEILEWKIQSWNDKKPLPDVFADVVLVNFSVGFEILERVNAKQFVVDVYNPPPDLVIAARQSFSLDDLIFDLHNSSMMASISKYSYWLTTMQGGDNKGGVYLYVDESVRPKSLVQFSECALVVGSSMRPDERVGEHESLMIGAGGRIILQSEIRIAKMCEAGRSVKGHVLIRNLKETAIRVVEHAIKSVICHTSIECLNQNPCTKATDIIPYESVKDQKQFGMFLLNFCWREWNQIATVPLRDFNQLVNEFEQISIENDYQFDTIAQLKAENAQLKETNAQLLYENEGIRIDSGIKSQFKESKSKRRCPNED